MNAIKTLYVDLETFSTIDLKTCGVYKYAEKVEILLFAYAFDDGPVSVWQCVKDPMPEDLNNYIFHTKKPCLTAHNSNFDRVVLEKVYPQLIRKLVWRDTMVRAVAHGLPGGLLRLSEIYKLPIDKAKDKEGHQLVYLFCKLQKDGSRATHLTHPKEWKKFVDYARLDIEAMRELDKKLPIWNDTEEERALWRLDQKINDRGYRVDIDLAKDAIKLVEKEKQDRNEKVSDLTEGAVLVATQRDALLKHILEEYEIELPDMQISTLKRRIEDPDLPDAVKELLILRLETSGTSTAKYRALLNAVNADGRLRGTLQFCGAQRTGRWGGRVFQPQNLPRPKFKADIIDAGIRTIKYGCTSLLFDNPIEIASSAIRGVIIPTKGCKLVVSDLSSIEGRMLAWLAGEEWKLQAYRDLDAGIGHDMYVLTYSKTFNIPASQVTEDQRQLGKVLELALGYGGGVGAFVTFAAGYYIDLDALAENADIKDTYALESAEAYWEVCVKERKTLGLHKKTFIVCDAIKRMWRTANPKTVQFWQDLQDAVYGALLYDRETKIGKVVVDKKGTWLRIRLPSGRYLCYAGAKVENKKITYLGINQYTRSWCRLSTYGGKLAENVTQAASRDILAEGMMRAEKAAYHVLLTVHDEIVSDSVMNEYFSHKELSNLLATNPSWAPDLPLAAKGFESFRYKKDK